MELKRIETVEHLANQELLPAYQKLKALAELFSCKCSWGMELESDELSGISAILRGLAGDLAALYDKLHDAIK